MKNRLQLNSKRFLMLWSVKETSEWQVVCAQCRFTISSETEDKQTLENVPSKKQQFGVPQHAPLNSSGGNENLKHATHPCHPVVLEILILFPGMGLVPYINRDRSLKLNLPWKKKKSPHVTGPWTHWTTEGTEQPWTTSISSKFSKNYFSHSLG